MKDPPLDLAPREVQGHQQGGKAMPSKSAAQAKLMRAVANNPEFARKTGIPQSVGKKYEAADKAAGRHRPRSRR